MTTPPSTRAYRALLRALPPIFRTSYAKEMEELFKEALRAHRRRGRLACLTAWMRGTVDVLFLALRLRFRPPSGKRRGPTEGGGFQPLLQDLHFSLRSLRRRPLFATVGILTLGLAIGASTAMFSVVDGVLLKALPYNEPGRLVAVWQTIPDRFGRAGIEGRLWDRARLTYSQYLDLSEENRIYERLAAYRAGTTDFATLSGIGRPLELRAGAASASLLPLLGVRPVLGRWFLPEEEARGSGQGGASVAVISHDLWQGLFGGTSDVLGSSVTLDAQPLTIVGVLPPGFRVHWLSASFAGEGDPGRRDIWLPVGAPGWPADRNAYSWEIIGRLARGVRWMKPDFGPAPSFPSIRTPMEMPGYIPVPGRRPVGSALLWCFSWGRPVFSSSWPAGTSPPLLPPSCGGVARSLPHVRPSAPELGESPASS